ncbi:hypothetical protein ACUHGC_05015 [Testudinibacter sp. P27/CKL/0425]
MTALFSLPDLPKVVLHQHLKGAIASSLAFKPAEKHQVRLQRCYGQLTESE